MDEWRADAGEAVRLFCVQIEDSWIGAKKDKKREKRWVERTLRMTGAQRAVVPVVAAVVAAGGGAASTAGGAWRWIGIPVAVAGAIGAFILALAPVDEYIRHRTKDRRYERLI